MSHPVVQLVFGVQHLQVTQVLLEDVNIRLKKRLTEGLQIKDMLRLTHTHTQYMKAFTVQLLNHKLQN